MMKRTAAILVFGIALLVGGVHASDIEKGFDAYGKGDYVEAVKWFRLSADQGNAEAQYYLAFMYDNGKGVTQDFKEAVKWHRLSAEQGNANAQTSLGFMYVLGQGVIQDDVYAHMWWNIEAEGGSSRAKKNRDKVASGVDINLTLSGHFGDSM